MTSADKPSLPPRPAGSPLLRSCLRSSRDRCDPAGPWAARSPTGAESRRPRPLLPPPARGCSLLNSGGGGTAETPPQCPAQAPHASSGAIVISFPAIAPSPPHAASQRGEQRHPRLPAPQSPAGPGRTARPDLLPASPLPSAAGRRDEEPRPALPEQPGRRRGCGDEGAAGGAAAQPHRARPAAPPAAGRTAAPWLSRNRRHEPTRTLRYTGTPGMHLLYFINTGFN